MKFRSKHIILLAVLALFQLKTSAQELNCNVKVNAPQLQRADPRIFETLQNAIVEFINDRKWTEDRFESHERIECSILITIIEELDQDKFKANIVVQSTRPVFSSSYSSVLFNHNDKAFVFNYSEYAPLEFNENIHTSNLTSVLGFYVNMILGMDYDSFSPQGGTKFFNKAQTIVDNASGESDQDKSFGWKAFDNSKNRYWLVKNILDPRYKSLRQVYYDHHIKGLDIMFDNANGGRKVILDGVKKLMDVNDENPNSMYMAALLSAKSNEYISVFSEGAPNEKSQAIQMLSILDPTNSQKYSRILR